jgi:hypothetical protein
MVNVVVGRKRDIRVSANATSGIIDTTVPVTIKNTPTFGNIGTTQRLDHLQDVSAVGEVSGAVPVYNSSIDKYVVQKLQFPDIVGDLDGGTF